MARSEFADLMSEEVFVGSLWLDGLKYQRAKGHRLILENRDQQGGRSNHGRAGSAW